MPYLVSSIIAIVAALIILMTRYEADDSAITAEIERAKSQFLAVDGFVNTYIQSGGDMNIGTIDESYTKLNFATLYKNGILLGNITKDDILGVTLNDSKLAGEETDKTKFFQSKLQFPKSNITWQIVPIVSGDTIKDSTGTDKNISSSAGTGYKVFVDFSANSTLKSKDAFSENFFGKEICEKVLFGSFINNATSISITTATLNQIITTNGTNKDSKFACVVFK
ncbi:hypothetical protein AFAEC_2164 [Aliarcobacter faecis]|uniref:hypothetical protein n=1 Tax=Aliarcobacter faecis TaxID=1564138 RepID=UPI00047A0696|nr:hypothetical protein [Aliarcobacter faecis]QKF74308.1 hypothetical protein AFAEC_2164 [Aliarcobacter faecis]